MLRGHIDSVEFGPSFVFLQGWVADGDTEPAVAPIEISFDCESPCVATLFERADLKAAGIADGKAGFAVALRRPQWLVNGLLQIKDGYGQVVQLKFNLSDANPFFARGAIDTIGPEGVYGWLFDPSVELGQVRASLLVDGKIKVDLPLTVDRDDLTYSQEFAEGRCFGFNIGPEILLQIVRDRRGADMKRPIEIILQSGENRIWRHEVFLTGGDSHGLPLERPPGFGIPPFCHIAPEKLKPSAVALPADETSGATPRNEAAPFQSCPQATIVSWDMSHNPVGRAYLLADIAAQFCNAKLIGPIFQRYGSQLWGPLRNQTRLSIETFRGAALKEYLNLLIDQVEKEYPAPIVYVSKARLPSIIFGLLMKLRHGSAVVVDVDDHELSFFRGAAPLNLDEALIAARRLPELAEMPFDEIWTRLTESLLSLADQLTVSNVALRNRFGGTIIRHARNEAIFRVTPERRRQVRAEFGLTDEDIVIVFVGTPRPHKGIFEIADALERIADNRLVFVMVGTITDKSVLNTFAKYKRARILKFEDQPFDRLHEVVSIGDVAPVLQRSDSEISDYQIPAKLTDAIALGIPVLATEVAPLVDLHEKNVFGKITEDNLESMLRQRLANPSTFDQIVANATKAYQNEFTYAANATRLREVFAKARRSARTKDTGAVKEVVEALYDFAGAKLPAHFLSNVAHPAVLRRGPRDLVFFWKQNDTDLYGRRSDMMLKYLIESGRIRRVLHLDRPRKLVELMETIDRGPYAKFHEGNLVFTNSVERMLKMRDSRRIAKRTYIHRDGSVPQSLLGQELPPVDGYLDFIRAEMKDLGLEPHPMAWVSPVVFDFPAVHGEVRFDPVVVDIIDDQRRWKVSDGYMQRVVRNYEECVSQGDLVLSNCVPVQQGFADLRSDIRVVPNGAEVFASDQAFGLPEDMAELPRPYVGYVGNLRDRIDVDLIRTMAQRHPDWSIVLIGSARGALEVIALGELPNVHLLGVRPYERALSYIKNFDVAIMPHMRNEISENMNPLKLYVYFALGVRIVTTEVANIDDIGPLVAVAQDHDGFIDAVASALEGVGVMISPEEHQRVLDRVSWRSRVEDAMRALEW